MVSYEPYDFRRSDKLSKDHVRTLQVIHETFSRLFTSSLSGYLRATVQIELVSIEQMPYEEYVRSISASLINILNVSQLSGQMMLEMDLRILFAMIDRLLGGAGEGVFKAGKDLTDVEKVLGGNITRRALDDLESSWIDILPLDFTVASVETSAQFVQIVPGNDTIVLVLFDIRLGDEQGTMSLSIPYMLLKPVAQRLHTQHWFANTRKIGAGLAPQMAARLREMTQVECSARLGTSQATVDAIANLRVGEILPLKIADQGEEGEGGAKAGLANVDVMVADKPKFRGHIGLRGGKRLAVQIDDFIPMPPTLQVHKEQVS